MTVDFEKLRNLLLNPKTPLAQRFRTIFTLKAFPVEESIDIISEGFKDSSALLKHELAYVLGQMQNPYAIKILSQVLSDVEENPMVRHEAGEALGAIGDPKSIEVLEKFVNDPSDAVRETCILAIDRIKNIKDYEKNSKNPFASVDPAPAEYTTMTAEELGSKLMDTSLSLYTRYKAMFSLRNQNSDESCLQLCRGLDDESALFRHEIAYVLGQLQNPVSIPALSRVLERVDSDMVRHECAEALGSIATEECTNILSRYLNDDQQVVRESCIVALDIAEYENSDSFQYTESIQ